MNILEKAREDINRIDSEIAHLFEERMAAVASVAAYKAENGLPILDAKREREVIVLRYGLTGKDPLPQREVAEKLGISRSYVSRIEKAALKKLREYC